MTTVDYSKMSLLRPDEVQAFQQGLRDFLTDSTPPTTIRSLMATEAGYDRETWQRACLELGLSGLAIAESRGGQGAGLIALSAAFEELGRAVSGLPLLSTIGLAAAAREVSGDEAAQGRYLPAIAAGTCTATLAWTRAGDSVTADSEGQLTGQVALVLDGCSSDVLLVLAEAPEGPTLRSVSQAATGLTSEPVATFDLTRKFARITLDHVPSEVVGAPGNGAAIVAQAREIAGLCLASEQLGGMSRCLEEAVDYARTRVQFGRYIGSFQAVKHRCADLLVETEAVRSAVHHAAWIAENASRDLPTAVAMAQAVASDGYVNVAAATMQLHGGISFTWEHGTHLHLKRAKAMQHFLGTSSSHRRLIAEALDL